MAIKLLPCPHCNSKEIDRRIYFNPDVWWDSALRGEECAIVYCERCGASIKGDSLKHAVSKWNKRVPTTDDYEVYG